MRLRALALLLRGVTMFHALTAEAAPSINARIHSNVHRTLQRQGTANIMVTMRESTQSVHESLPLEASFTTRGAMITDMVDKLEALAKLRSRSYLSVYFRDATFALVEKLATVSSVAAIEEERVYQIADVADVAGSNSSSRLLAGEDDPNGAIPNLQAKEVWAKGFTGQGVVVSSITSGVRASHEALRGNFRKDFGWYDPVNKTTAAYDDNGSGTEFMGAAIGWRELGVAPGASWISCKGCSGGGCPSSDLMACAEFITCPTNPSGSTRDCSKAPNILLINWGSTDEDPVLLAWALAWRRAGVIPIFSMPDRGPDCSTAGSPGNSPYAISVGSTDKSDALASFSGKGPTLAGLTKPDVVAPDVYVVLPSATGDDHYVYTSGGPAAAGYVAGVVALMLSSEPALKFEQIRQMLLFEGTDQTTLPPADRECGGTPNGQFPNNMYGYGRVNALKAANSKRVPVAGQCGGLVNPVCNSIFFCMWSNVKQSCQSWW